MLILYLKGLVHFAYSQGIFTEYILCASPIIGNVGISGIMLVLFSLCVRHFAEGVFANTGSFFDLICHVTPCHLGVNLK